MIFDGRAASAATTAREVGRPARSGAGRGSTARRVAGRARARCSAGRWGKTPAAKSSTEARTRARKVEVMRAGSEQARVEAQPTHGRQQGRQANL